MHSAVYRCDAIIVAVFLTSEVQVQWYYTAIPITTTILEAGVIAILMIGANAIKTNTHRKDA